MQSKVKQRKETSLSGVRVKDLPDDSEQRRAAMGELVGVLEAVIEKINTTPIHELIGTTNGKDRLGVCLESNPQIRTVDLGVVRKPMRGRTLGFGTSESVDAAERKMASVRLGPRSLYPICTLESYCSLTSDGFLVSRVTKTLEQLVAHGFVENLFPDVGTIRVIRKNHDLTDSVEHDDGCTMLVHLPLTESAPGFSEMGVPSPSKLGKPPEFAVSVDFDRSGNVTAVRKHWSPMGDKMSVGFDAHLFVVPPTKKSDHTYYYRRVLFEEIREPAERIAETGSSIMATGRIVGRAKTNDNMTLDVYEFLDQGKPVRYGLLMREDNVRRIYRISEVPCAQGKVGKSRFGVYLEPLYMGIPLEVTLEDQINGLSARVGIQRERIADALDEILSVDPDLPELDSTERREVKRGFMGNNSHVVAAIIKLKDRLDEEDPELAAVFSDKPYVRLMHATDLIVARGLATNRTYALKDVETFRGLWGNVDEHDKAHIRDTTETRVILEELEGLKGFMRDEIGRARAQMSLEHGRLAESIESAVRLASESTQEQLRGDIRLLVENVGRLDRQTQERYYGEITQQLRAISAGLPEYKQTIETALNRAQQEPLVESGLKLTIPIVPLVLSAEVAVKRVDRPIRKFIRRLGETFREMMESLNEIDPSIIEQMAMYEMYTQH